MLPWLGLLVVALGGCELFTESNRPPLSVELAGGAYAPGATVAVTLRNASDSPWYHIGVCNSGFERRDGDAWVPVYGFDCRLVVVDPSTPPDRLTYAPLEVPARGEVNLNYVLPGDAVPGTHRIRASFMSRADGSGSSATRVSPTFEVRSPSLAAR
ncbi:MAG: hypothetical protein C0503_06880 [Gemmatimonas sp.]|nr:hypothetical protein [Gemmatimonas sp.]